MQEYFHFQIQNFASHLPDVTCRVKSMLDDSNTKRRFPWKIFAAYKLVRLPRVHVACIASQEHGRTNSRSQEDEKQQRHHRYPENETKIHVGKCFGKERK